MDPKMDQCFGFEGSIKMDDLLKPEFPIDFNEKHLLGIFKTLFIYEISYLDGSTLLDTSLNCIFMWSQSWKQMNLNSNELETFSMKQLLLKYINSYCKTLNHITQAVYTADIYEGLSFFMHSLFYLSFLIYFNHFMYLFYVHLFIHMLFFSLFSVNHSLSLSYFRFFIIHSIHSFIHLFIYLFIHSSIHSFIH